MWGFFYEVISTFNTNLLSMIKKILGYIFIVIAAILGVAIFFQLKESQSSINNIFLYFFTNSIDDYTLGCAVGSLLANITFILIAVGLFIIGKKWIKKKKSQ